MPVHSRPGIAHNRNESMNRNVYLKDLNPGSQFYYCGMPYLLSGTSTYGDVEARPMVRVDSRRWTVLEEVKIIRGSAIVRTF